MEDDDFTFPAPAVAATLAPSSQDGLGVGLLWPAASALWPFSSTMTADDAAPASGGQAVAVAVATPVAPRRDEEEEEERMDQLWEHERDARAGEEERMDLLWEDFNDELLLQLRRQRAATASPADVDSPSPDEEETSTSSPPGGGGGGLYGCAPTMLRASSRAGAVGQFYGRRGHGGGSRATTGWELLLRLFRKLFAVDKSSPAPPCHHHHRRHGSIYVP